MSEPLPLLAQAIACDDVDAAIKPIMDALGIIDGDVASHHLSPEAWRQVEERRSLLAEWLRHECWYADLDHRGGPGR